jgi:hypothetical protein
MGAPDGSRKRTGHFSASGEYLWYGLSAGLDEHQGLYEVLDLRRKVDTQIKSFKFVTDFFGTVRQPFSGVLWS